MSTFKISEHRRDTRSLSMSSRREFTSSSSGITGSLGLIARPTTRVKTLSSYETVSHKDSDVGTGIAASVASISASIAAGVTNVSGKVESLLGQISSASRTDPRASVSFAPRFHVFDPAVETFAVETEGARYAAARRYISGSLVPYYAPDNQGKFMGAGNYFSLNFFTASSVPSDSAIVFPDFVAPSSYAVSDGITIDLHINPRYTTDRQGDSFRAGVIAHSPGNYYLAITSGSSRGGDGRPDAYRVVLALSHSANISPSDIDLAVANGSRSYPQDLIFVSKDNALRLNSWHHLEASWSSKKNSGTGSFHVDGTQSGLFSLPSASIAPTSLPGCLVVGNHLNSAADGSRLFNAAVAAEQGLMPNVAFASGDPSPGFANPLNAEIHSLKIYGRCLTDAERERNASTDFSVQEERALLYMPPYFMHESPLRNTPVSLDTKLFKMTEHPVNKDLMFGCGGRDVNVENYVRNLVKFGSTAGYPRLYNLTGTLVGLDTALDFNSAYYANPHNRKRNLTVLPCDDGQYRLQYASLASVPAVTGSLRSYRGAPDYSTIGLTAITNAYPATSPTVLKTTPEDPTGQPIIDQATGNGYYAAQYYSQEQGILFGTLIDIPVLTYGHSVLDKTFTVLDSAMTGSNGKVRITLKDDGKNGLYRADANTLLATWNTQGLFFENEGVGLVFSPVLAFFGKHQWACEFETDASAHVLTVDVKVPAGTANVSQNDSYLSFPPTGSPFENAKNFVYIDTINLHDENLNVIARATLSQPFLKRPDEDVLFRLKLDF